MRRVAVVTDSSACLPLDLVEEFGIRVLPISAHLSDDQQPETHLSESDSTWRLPESVEREELAGANHPFVTEYLQAMEEPGFEAAVVITPAIEFATMFRNAAIAAELATRPAVTIDARTAAAGQALVVLAGAEEAARGSDLSTVVRVIEEASRRVELVASLATLEPIRQSGPVPDEILGPRASSGTRSVFRMQNGTVTPLGSTTTLDETLNTIRDAFFASRTLGIDRSTVFHADVPELAQRLVDLLESIDFVSGFSLAMQVHTGRGVVGAAWLPSQQSR